MVRRLGNAASVEAYPMLGQGSAYADVCPIVGPRASLASGGARTAKGSLRRDVAAGGLRTVPPALKFLRKIKGHYDRVIVVGDMIGALAAFAVGHRNLFYIDVYKTGSARLYSAAERWAIKKSCDIVYCRADNLAASLRDIGVDARCAGNVMMDTIPYGNYDAASRRTKPLAVTLLPGSRGVTGENLALQVAALRKVPPALLPDVFLAVAGGLNVDDLARDAGLQRTPMLSAESGDMGTLSDGRLTIHMASGSAMGNLVAASDLVLSQAGTATTQSLGLGRPSITFVSANDRRSRFLDEQALFGEARIGVPATPEGIAEALQRLLENPDELARLSAIGRERIGPPGAMQAILAALQEARPAVS